MVARIRTIAFQGVDVLGIDVQAQISQGLPSFTIVGLPDKAVGESRERVRAALHAMGLALPPKRITINLAPADVQKEGSHFDLPIALALLVAMDVISGEELASYTALGELALDGGISAVAGVLPAAVDALTNDHGLICPAACGAEAAWAGDLDVIAPPSLIALINHLRGHQVLTPPSPPDDPVPGLKADLADVRGQETARRALEITAAGGHNMLMCGPPGSGKSMLAARLPGIMPPLTAREALDVSMIHSVAGLLADGKLLHERPFRDPHHSASPAALVGGGLRVRPGEISLAHNGILFLDELPEFQRSVLEALRQPMETGEVVVARANHHVRYPAKFQFIAAMNPCRCAEPDGLCRRGPRCASDYQARISGPIYDRIDLHVEVPAVKPRDLAQEAPGETSAAVLQRVMAARRIQTERFAALGKPELSRNSELAGDMLTEAAAMLPEAQEMLYQAADRMGLSARGYHRVIRVSRTIADLAAETSISRSHVAEALSYRRMIPGMAA
ncbi:MAG: AAA family ATPase [Alphaproteobacteria bacterium]|nr:AAA family ATPase [Alphaproteobacteria bacterium]MAS47519.1 AAA family ATPase [Alphaproteobacteria bacterium]MBN52173.1 AAA family ATPase [Alphaproteobacteria bacterium]OUT40991.1 MAG: AAA family ATPase [Micavibrio sp. TMED2]|tara:strand:+ start:20425 stop:21939 length:1515 start_codon:yes stop_codon:yes gene_type:complete